MQTSGGDVEGLPDSVLGIVTARVDLLPPAEKELLRDAAVMGGVVWSDGLRVGLGAGRARRSTSCSARSGARSSSVASGSRRSLGATQHAFVHTLVRDAVYAQLPRPDRVDRHVRVARWIESLPEDRREDRAELLAHHYVEAIELARSAGLDVSDLEPRAAAALREAGMRAFAIGAFPAAVRALRGAAEWLPDGLDARALRALGKALSFTENTGDDELRRAFDRLVPTKRDRGGGGHCDRPLASSRWRHGDGAAAADWMARALELVAGTSPTASTRTSSRRRRATRWSRATRTRRSRSRTGRSSSRRPFDAPRVGARRRSSRRATAMANVGDYETCARGPPGGDRRSTPRRPVRAHARVCQPRLGAAGPRRRSTEAIEVGARGVVAVRANGDDRRASGGSSSATSSRRSSSPASGTRRRRSSTDGLEHARADRRALPRAVLRVRAGRARARPRRSRERGGGHRRAAWSRSPVSEATTRPSSRPCAVAAWTLVRAGHDDEAGALLDELLERRRANPTGVMPGCWTTYIALTLERIGRPGRARRPRRARGLALPRGRRSRSTRAGRRTRRRRLRAMGAPQLEAEARVLAARERAATRGTRRARSGSSHVRASCSPRSARRRGSGELDDGRSAAAAAERDRRLAACEPVVHPAVDDGPRVEALRPQDARRDRGARARAADRDDRPVLGKVGAAGAHQPVRARCGCRGCSRRRARPCRGRRAPSRPSAIRPSSSSIRTEPVVSSPPPST